MFVAVLLLRLEIWMNARRPRDSFLYRESSFLILLLTWLHILARSCFGQPRTLKMTFRSRPRVLAACTLGSKSLIVTFKLKDTRLKLALPVHNSWRWGFVELHSSRVRVVDLGRARSQLLFWDGSCDGGHIWFECPGWEHRSVNLVARW